VPVPASTHSSKTHTFAHAVHTSAAPCVTGPLKALVQTKNV
jgi:hypothetical protein